MTKLTFGGDVKRTFCTLCPQHCGMLIQVEDGLPVRFDGDRENPVAKGKLCIKGTACLELHDHPDRVDYPLKRVGARGEGRWERIGWDQALDGSLERLRTDVVDVYFYHRPDGLTPFSETIGALGELVREGKVRYVGVSNVDAPQLEEAAAAAAAEDVPLVCVENRYSLVRRDAEAELLPLCERLGLGLIPFYPLESGVLTGKYRRGEPLPAGSRLDGSSTIWPAERWLTDEVFDRVEALERYAAERGLSLLEVAIGGLLAMPAVASVIAGATQPEQVRANVRASGWRPDDDDDLAALAALRFPG